MGNSQGKPVVFTDNVNLNHFRLLRVVGKGAFGKVRIVERKDTGLTFALKYIRKDEVVRSESVQNVIRERRMMEHLNHPFICNLRYSFQDLEYMYIVLDLMTGGDLRFHITRKTFTEDAVRFWVAELGCALQYIHENGIVHRDVKPDNVLLDSEGHVHLADFNVASDYKKGGKPLTSKSGTLAYLAPEVYSGNGYGPGADWWSLGVLFYECIYSKRPFEGSNQANLSHSIKAAKPKFPTTSPPVSMVCMHAISSALEPVSTQRMGSASWESFTDNPFFREIDFEALLRKEIEPIFVPSSEKRNFDATYDLEELLLEEAPLEARARRQKPREPLKEGATDKEIRTDELYRLIETHFKPFDYTVAAYKRYTNSAPNELPCLTLGASNLEPISRSESPSSTFQPGQAMPYGSSSRTDTPATQTSTRPSPMAGSLSAFHPQRNPANRTGQLDHVSTTDTAGSEDSHWQPKQYTTGSLQHSAVRQIGGNQKHGRPGSSNNLVLDGTESWSDLAVKDTTLPADAKEGLSSTGEKKKEGMLGFFRSKKGRGASPKPMERGVLSVKDGGRVVVGHN